MIFFGRSHFSIGESLLSPEDIAKLAKANGYTAAALTDTMSISGMVDFTTACQKEGIKPIVGCRVRVVADPTLRKPPRKSGLKMAPNPEWFIDLYIVEPSGFGDLTALLSKGGSPEYFYHVPRVSLNEVCEALRGNALAAVCSDLHSVLMLSDCRDTLKNLIAATRFAKRKEIAMRFTVQHTPLNDRLNELGEQLAREFPEIVTIASHTAFYKSPDDADARDVYAAICGNVKMADPWRKKPFLRDFTPRTTQELREQLIAASERMGEPNGDMHADALLSEQEVFEACINYVWGKMPISLPKLADNEFAVLASLCATGWKERLQRPVLGYQPPAEMLDTYRSRLKYELATLKRMGFEGYFLLVRDLVMWSKNNGIRVGPGRGSVGGSLVAYLIGITDVDPIRFNLLFERFINPDRIDLPDADLDFMSTRRQEVIEYLTKKYGAEKVAGISNYGTLASASALRDTGRVFGLELSELDATKLVPKVHGKPMPLNEAMESVPQLEAFRTQHPQIWDNAVKLEGKIRNLGRHAAGVVVAGCPVMERAVVESRSGEAVINWDKRYSEDMGLVKLDVLGLSTLDVIDGAIRRINERTGTVIEPLSLPLDDEPTMDAFSQGMTTGVFQFESPGMRNLLKNLAKGGRLVFDDLVAATALYRPGPMDSGLLDDFVAYRQGMRPATYDHPRMQDALQSTGGVIVYQEQVMQVARDLAGYTMADADKLRKIMGKKQPEEMKKQKDKFCSGCVTTSGTSMEFAERLFDKIELFAGYAFNLSHSAEYAVISYWTMYLKVHYPAEFFTASLDMADQDKAAGVVADAAQHGVAIVPPDLNNSSARFEVGYDPLREQTVIMAPFSAIKGVSSKGCLAIIEARDKVGGRFKSVEEFIDNVNRRQVNVRVQESLRKVGAFAALDPKELPARHPDRLRDQLELLPGLISDAVRADRKIELDKFIKAKVIHNINDFRNCKDCSLAGRVHPIPALGKRPKFMVVFDSPSWSEDASGKIMEGKSSEYVREALKAAGLGIADGYFTSLVKSMKPEDGLKNEHINACNKFLLRELEILKPPVIIAMGGAAIRHFVPGAKGGSMELAGRRVWDKKLDATVVCGFNPGMIAFDEKKMELLQAIFAAVAELVL